MTFLQPPAPHAPNNRPIPPEERRWLDLMVLRWDAVVAQHGYSGRARRRVRQAARACFGDRRDLLAFSYSYLGHRRLRKGRRPGRPRRAALL